MDRSDITELCHITPIGNVPSILKHGIFSHVRAGQMPHGSLAMPEIQERRRNKQIPGGRNLHEYVNLYFDAHNPMLSVRRDQNDSLCVLRVDSAVLELPRAIIADHNAASDYAKFIPFPRGLEFLDRNRLYARYWTHPENPFDEMCHKSEKCAEFLVPDCVDARFVIGSYVANSTALARFNQLRVDLTVEVKSDMFF